MSFLLDTNILSAHLRRPSGLAHRFVQYYGRLYTSSVVLAMEAVGSLGGGSAGMLLNCGKHSNGRFWMAHNANRTQATQWLRSVLGEHA